MLILTSDESSRIQSEAIRLAESIDLHLLRFSIRGTRSRPIIEIVLDGERWVTLNDCEAVSKKLQVVLDETLGIGCNYRIDVTSPGTDEPLKEDYQYKKSIGKLLQITKTDGTVIKGILDHFTDDEIILLSQKQGKKEVELVEIPREKVKKALVMIQFS
jgi:ribosome maturation factor RimP